jgi:hypothetical protein
MGRWRGRRLFAAPHASAAALSLALGAVALLGAGCGAETHVNDPRPQPPTRVSVTVSDDQVTVQPPRIAVGLEPTQQIPQNAHAGQPPVRSDAPLNVVFVVANLTGTDSHLQVRGSGKSLTSQPLYANNNVDMPGILPTGVYHLSAADIPSAKPAKLVVGPVRTSSQNDVLLP